MNRIWFTVVFMLIILNQVRSSAQSIERNLPTSPPTGLRQPQVAVDGKSLFLGIGTLNRQKIAEERERLRQIAVAQQRAFDLKYWDTNKDGKLDAREQRARTRWYKENVPNSLPLLDKNGNGIIEPEDFQFRRPGQPRQ